MLSRFADRCLFSPSRHALPTEGKTRRAIPFEGGELEVWTQRTPFTSENGPREPALFVLKLAGMGGRAERATLHPFDYWADVPGEVWALNPPGYGGSSGRATLRLFAAAVRRVFQELQRVVGDRPIVVTGNSLGTAAALHLAAIGLPVSSMILRNPPPLKQLIRGKFGWRTLGLGPLMVGSQIPAELDSVANAAASQMPAVILTSLMDRTVPAIYQRLITDTYAGPKQIVQFPDADHVFEMSLEDQRRYGESLLWLRTQFASRLSVHAADPSDRTGLDNPRNSVQ